jgi:cyclophilin family peptidyl-prolyl cis-trans isomerase
MASRKNSSKKTAKKKISKNLNTPNNQPKTNGKIDESVIIPDEMKGDNNEILFSSNGNDKSHNTSLKNQKPSADSVNISEILDKTLATILGLGLIGLFGWFMFDTFPNKILSKDKDIIAEEKAQEDAQKDPVTDPELLAKETETLKFSDQTVQMGTNFGDLNIIMLDKAAPKNTENILRLTSRGYFNNLKFHRMVEQDNFKVLQGGDPDGNGAGGVSAFGTDVVDEVYITKPEFAPDGESQKLINTPKFTSDLYKNFDSKTGQVEYQKGLMIMANRGPDTNSSQFFITLDKTILPASYTIVGQIKEDGFAVLDKILTEVDPVNASSEAVKDGKPNKDIVITSMKTL